MLIKITLQSLIQMPHIAIKTFSAQTFCVIACYEIIGQQTAANTKQNCCHRLNKPRTYPRIQACVQPQTREPNTPSPVGMFVPASEVQRGVEKVNMCPPNASFWSHHPCLLSTSLSRPQLCRNCGLSCPSSNWQSLVLAFIRKHIFSQIYNQ